MKHEMKELLGFTGGRNRFLLLLALRAPFNALHTIIYATFLRDALNAISMGDTSTLALACAVFSVATLCLFLYNGTIWRAYSSFVVTTEGTLREKLFQKLARLSCEQVEAKPQGQWITLLNVDVEAPFSRPLHLPHATNAIVCITLSGLMLLFMSPALFALAVCFIIPHILISQLFIARAMPNLHQAALDATAAYTDKLASLITCAHVAALYNAEPYMMSQYEKSSNALCASRHRIKGRHAIGNGLLPLFGAGGYLLLLVISGEWIGSGALTFGSLTAAFQYRGSLLAGITLLTSSLIAIQETLPSMRRINSILTLTEQEEFHG